MRNLSWSIFAVTGDIEAYLLYKEIQCLECDQGTQPEEKLEEVNSLEEQS